MPVTTLVKDEWVALAEGPTLDDIILDNDQGDVVLVSTEDLGDDRGYITLKPGETFAIPKGNFAFLRCRVTRRFPWIYNITTGPSVPQSALEVDADIDETFSVDLGEVVSGNVVRYALVSVETASPVTDSNVEVNPYTGVVTGSFDEEDEFTITVSATNAAGSENVEIVVTVTNPE